jgi:hypothetical protein
MTEPIDWGDIPEQILLALRDFGPMTGHDLADVIRVSVDHVNKALRRMREPSRRRKPLGERRVHIVDWTRDAENARAFPRAVYQIGHGQNRARPPAKPRREIVRQQRIRKIGKTRMNFAFNLGAPL